MGVRIRRVSIGERKYASAVLEKCAHVIFAWKPKSIPWQRIQTDGACQAATSTNVNSDHMVAKVQFFLFNPEHPSDVGVPNLLLVPPPLLPHMSVLAALATLLLFSCCAIAQIETAKCTQSSWNWVRTRNNYVSDPTCFRLADESIQTFNSMNQNPCKVAGYLLSTCSGGSEYSSWLGRRDRLIYRSVYH